MPAAWLVVSTIWVSSGADATGHCFEAVAKRGRGRSAPLATSAHSDGQYAVRHLNDRDLAPVGRDRWIHFAIEELFDRSADLLVIAA